MQGDNLMKSIMEKLTTLANEPSKLAKVGLLKEYLKSEKFRVVVEMTLDETLHYNISKLPTNVPKQIEPNFDALMDYLYFLSGKQGASIDEKRSLAAFAINDDWENVITKIIQKDLKCGCKAKLINKASPGSITEIPYLGCKTSKYLKHINLPAYAQIKEDGLFVNIFHNQRKITYLSRNGNEFIFPEDSLTREINKYYPKLDSTYIYMGEFRIKIHDEWLPRKTSNGILNKALKKNQTILENESRKVHFICWDVIPETDFWETKCSTPYIERFQGLQFMKNMDSKRLQLSETRVIETIREAQDWALELIKTKKEEGVIIKNYNSLWSYTHSSEQIKLKAGDIGIGDERESELKVVDWYWGKKGTKFEGCLGGLVCESSDSLLRVNVGGGFTQEERGFLEFNKDNKPIIVPNFEEWMEQMYMDKIITVRFNECIKAKTSKRHSLFSPRFVEVRLDKNEADTLQYIKEDL